jgi:hypothetical protein
MIVFEIVTLSDKLVDSCFFDKKCSPFFNHQDTKSPRHNEKPNADRFACDLS